MVPVAQGTPKTLDHAIYFALCVGPLSEIRNRAYAVFKDFLAQRFGAAMLKHPECGDILKELFESIVERKDEFKAPLP